MRRLGSNAGVMTKAGRAPDIGATIRPAVRKGVRLPCRGEPPFDGGLDEVGCEEGERDRHVDLAHAAALALGDDFDACRGAGDEFIEPAAAAGDGGNQERTALGADRTGVFDGMLDSGTRISRRRIMEVFRHGTSIRSRTLIFALTSAICRSVQFDDQLVGSNLDPDQMVADELSVSRLPHARRDARGRRLSTTASISVAETRRHCPACSAWPCSRAAEI